MKDEIKVGDKITWNEHPNIKSTVIKIERSRFTDVKMYVCSNGCRFQKKEITKVFEHAKTVKI